MIQVPHVYRVSTGRAYVDFSLRRWSSSLGTSTAHVFYYIRPDGRRARKPSRGCTGCWFMPACRKPPSEQGLAALGPAIRPAAFAEPTGSSGVGSSPSRATAPESSASRHHGSRRLPAMAESQHQSPLVLSLQERQSRRWCLQVREYTAWYADNSARKSDGHGGFTARMMDDRHARERHIPTTLMEVHPAKHSAYRRDVLAALLRERAGDSEEAVFCRRFFFSAWPCAPSPSTEEDWSAPGGGVAVGGSEA